MAPRKSQAAATRPAPEPFPRGPRTNTVGGQLQYSVLSTQTTSEYHTSIPTKETTKGQVDQAPEP